MKEINLKNTKADIFKELQRLRDILKQIHALAASWSEIGANAISNGGLRPILKKPQPSNQPSKPTISTVVDCGGKDVLGRVREIKKKPIGNSKATLSHESNGRPTKISDKGVECGKPVVGLIFDTEIQKHTQKVKQEHVQQQQQQPLRRSKRVNSTPDQFLLYYCSSKDSRKKK